MNTNNVYPPVRQQPIVANTSIYSQVPPSIVPSTNTLTQLPNQFTDNGYIIQSNTTMRNALVQPVTNTCISTSNQQQNPVPTTSMTNETRFAFLIPFHSSTLFTHIPFPLTYAFLRIPLSPLPTHSTHSVT
jgi:hypothetical protein